MNSYTAKNAAGRIYLAVPLLAILLTASPMPAKAGLLDTVNDKVTTIKNRVGTIMSNTNGLGEFITTLRDIRGSLGGGMISDMRDTVGETQNLIQFLKDRRDSAGQTSQYPSLPNLVRSLDGIADVLTDRAGQGGALEGLSALLDVLPDRALAPVARIISRTGVDAEFVAKIDQMGTDLIELRDILKETNARREEATQAAGDYSVAGDGLLFAEFGCHIRGPAQLLRLNRAAKVVKKTADVLKVYGSLIEIMPEAVTTDKGIGIWGWVTLKVKVKVPETTGKLMGVFAEGALVLVDSAQNVIDTCEEQFMDQA